MHIAARRTPADRRGGRDDRYVAVFSWGELFNGDLGVQVLRNLCAVVLRVAPPR